MKIEISERPSNEPLFPAFYKDITGALWFWGDEHSFACLSDGSIGISNDHEDIDFYDYTIEWEFTRVYGTITITV